MYCFSSIAGSIGIVFHVGGREDANAAMKLSLPPAIYLLVIDVNDVSWNHNIAYIISSSDLKLDRATNKNR